MINTRSVKKLVPVGVVFALAYFDFATFYSLAYQEIYLYHSKGIAISVWVLVGISQLFVFVYWCLMLQLGPGMSPKIAPLDLYDSNDSSLTSLPEYFICDESGMPFYCSACESIKTPRSFHLMDMNYCVQNFDHYCLWIGTAIGHRNYLPFVKFLIWFTIYFLLVIIYLARFTRSNIKRGSHDINHNYIILYIFCGIFLSMLLLMTYVYIYYISINKTTLDEISSRQLRRYLRWKAAYEKNKVKKLTMPRIDDGRRFINLRRNGVRYLVEYHVTDTIFSQGLKRNWINFIFSNDKVDDAFYSNKRFLEVVLIIIAPLLDIFYIPFSSNRYIVDHEKANTNILELYSDKLADKFLKHAWEKIDSDECNIVRFSPQFTTASPRLTYCEDNIKQDSS
ncbi:uncharacterized protein PRCAT00005986001 [Priceomyces carsonii]|uniref:uncharacterized protein n=1 Tax=Priceomyces carsonii TaxID=28549 RepID=UPI002ED9A9EF|nr:unnamed protein product [Priceomyces carsonii]